MFNETKTLSQKITDQVVKIVGSWPFFFGCIILNVIWIYVNESGYAHFDPSPHILLNLVISILSFYYPILIMIGQRRLDEKDRKRDVENYETNQRTETLVKELISVFKISNEKLMDQLDDLEEDLEELDKDIEIVDNIVDSIAEEFKE